MNKKDLGIVIISRFYIVLIFLYVLPLFLFTTQLNILGRTFSSTTAFIGNMCFIAILWFLYRKIKNTKKIGFWTALIFHTFFIVNSVLMVMESQPLLMIEGIKAATPEGVKPILSVSIILNLIIISYLIYRKKLFFHKGDEVGN